MTVTRFLIWPLLLALLAACEGGSGADSKQPRAGDDTTPPRLVLRGDNPLLLKLGETYHEPGAWASDDRDGAVPVRVSGAVNTHRAGVYTLIYTARDKSGNTARAERRVVVETLSGMGYPPESLTLDGDLTTEGYEGDAATPRPGLNEWIDESGSFKTRITRVTDAAVTVVQDGEKSPVHHYPKDQAWNSDQTLLVLGGRWLVQADTYERIRRVSSYKRWSHSDPDLRIGLEKCGGAGGYCVASERVSSGEITTLYRIPGEYERMTLGEYEGNLDFHDRYIVLTGRRVENHDSEIATIILYDLKQNRAIIKDFDGLHKLYLSKTYKNNKLDWASVTPTGRYVLIHKYADIRSGVPTDNKKVVEVYDLELNFLYTLAYKANHGDICISTDGKRDYYVQFENEGPGAFDRYAGASREETQAGVWQYDLETGERVRLVANHGGGHVSCRNHLRYGWAYVSYKKTIDMESDHPYLYRDVFAVELGPEGQRDGERAVERFANSRYMKKDNSSCDYKYTDLGPHALPSPDGTMVLFKSNWSPGGCLDDFLASARPQGR